MCVCSCSKCVPDQCQLFDRLPSLCVEEFLSYSSSLSAFYHLDHVYTPVTMETIQTHEHNTQVHVTYTNVVLRVEKSCRSSTHR